MLTRITAGALLLVIVEPVLAQQACSKLTGLSLPHTTIVSAVAIPAGPLPLPATFGSVGSINAPARCEVQAITRPTKDSEIRLQVWLPVSGWNGKYLQVGNGGWAGSIDQTAMVEPLRRGYAVAATDDGHQSSGTVPDAAWAAGHPEKLIDFGYRAVHETSIQAKAILGAYFGRDAALSYFNGCSDGGREALMEAQRYPEDFNGIVAGSPANNWSHHFAGFVWNEQAMAKNPIPPSKLAPIQSAVLAACDSVDGVKDGLIEDPRSCRFDPGALLCKAGDAPDCLSAGQVDTLRAIYGGPRNPRTGKQIYPGYPMGAEAIPGGWAPWIVSPGIQALFGNSHFGQAVFEQSNWDFRTLNFDADIELSDTKTGRVLDSTNPDLRSFRANGGKLIQYHGWGDAAIAPQNSIDYHESVRAFFDRYPDARHAKADPADFYRLFLVPGMAHCAGGIGPNEFGNGRGSSRTDDEHNVLSALEAWVERGLAPAKLIGTGTTVADPTKPLTRPLCPYPQVARYRGVGDVNDAANFSCAASPDRALAR